MADNRLMKILEDKELKEILEKKGFEEIGAKTFLFSDKKEPERYLTLNALVGMSLNAKDEKVIIELSKIEDSGNYFIKVYSKK